MVFFIYSLSKKVFHSKPILHLHGAILSKGEHKKFQTVPTALVASYFVEHLQVVASKTLKWNVIKTHEDVLCAVLVKIILEKDQRKY